MNKNYTYLALVAILTAMLFTSGCRTGADNSESSTVQTESQSDSTDVSNVTAEKIYEARCQYIGEAPSVGKLVGLVKSYYGIGQSNTMELQTAEIPYGIALHFEKKPDNIAMQRMAAVLISLIEKCRAVTWDYPFDEDGNREAVYFSYANMQSMVNNASGSGYIGDAGESEEKFIQFLSRLEEIKEMYPAVNREATIEKAVSASILLYNKDLYSYSEAVGEGHIIMQTEEKKEGEGEQENTVTVYALTMYGGYEFQNGNFVKNGGTGVVPAVIKLSKEPDGTYFMKDYQKARDGGEYKDSIHKLFPEALWEQCISPSDAVREEITAKERAYAADYLKSIGRETAVIGDYADFTYVSLTDAGMSVEASNKFLEDRKYITDPVVAYAPSWLGSVERLEAGERYLYQLSCDPETFEIILTRSKYLTKEPGERVIYDVVTGAFNKE